jgi:hypothetical protein
MIHTLRSLVDWLEDRELRAHQMTDDELRLEIDDCRAELRKKSHTLDVILTNSPKLAENRQEIERRNHELFWYIRRVTILLIELETRAKAKENNEHA